MRARALVFGCYAVVRMAVVGQFRAPPAHSRSFPACRLLFRKPTTFAIVDERQSTAASSAHMPLYAVSLASPIKRVAWRPTRECGGLRGERTTKLEVTLEG